MKTLQYALLTCALGYSTCKAALLRPDYAKATTDRQGFRLRLSTSSDLAGFDGQDEGQALVENKETVAYPAVSDNKQSINDLICMFAGVEEDELAFPITQSPEQNAQPTFDGLSVEQLRTIRELMALEKQAQKYKAVQATRASEMERDHVKSNNG